jgi:hypothetical protein
VKACLDQVDEKGLCLPRTGRERVFPLRLALDPRYAQHWPGWQDRLGQTLGCVNRLYRGTGVAFHIAELKAWAPASSRHDLYALLDRIQSDFPPDLKSLLVGITVWDERRIYATAGGEIGLSQRAAAVVPSWPRVENDCLILAHELGHLVGARHVPGKQWIMGWAARPFHLPAADPIGRVVATYRFHPRNVEAIRAHRQARFTPNGLALPPECRERIALLDRCWKLPP